MSFLTEVQCQQGANLVLGIKGSGRLEKNQSLMANKLHCIDSFENFTMPISIEFS